MEVALNIESAVTSRYSEAAQAREADLCCAVAYDPQYFDVIPAEILVNSFNLASVAGLMCRSTLNIGWRGEVYDCDFNQMLNLQWRNGKPLFLWDTKPEDVQNRPILTGDHCFGCTAGAGSSCGGAILPA